MKRITIILFAALLVFAACKKEDDELTTPPPPPPTVYTVTENITVNTTWTTGSVYIIDGTLYIDNATLTIQPGTTVKFKDGSQINIGYSETGSVLIANGTAAAPILFTSYASTPTAGDWDGIFFENGTASTSSLQFCKFEYGGGYSSTYGTINLDDCKISMDNCTVTNSDSYGITVDSDAEFKSFTNNIVNNTASHLMKMYPSNAHTIGAGNVFTAINSSVGILVKSGTFDNSEETWLAQTVSYIIDGTIYIESTSGAILNIQEGTTVAFTKGSQIDVGYGSSKYGKLVAQGTSSDRILFTSSAPVGSASAGDWDAIFFEDGTSAGSILDNCDLSYGGGYSSSYGMVDIDDNGTNVTISNCNFSYSESHGISVDASSATPTLTNNTFSNISGDDVHNY